MQTAVNKLYNIFFTCLDHQKYPVYELIYQFVFNNNVLYTNLETILNILYPLFCFKMTIGRNNECLLKEVRTFFEDIYIYIYVCIYMHIF